MVKRVQERKYSWKEMVDKQAGPEQPVLAYNFKKRKLYENPNRPYGPKR